jgi:hypothetical protein
MCHFNFKRCYNVSRSVQFSIVDTIGKTSVLFLQLSDDLPFNSQHELPVHRVHYNISAYTMRNQSYTTTAVALGLPAGSQFILKKVNMLIRYCHIIANIIIYVVCVSIEKCT